MICMQCGSVMPNGEKLCSECGWEAPNIIPVDENGKVIKGASFDTAPAPAPAPTPAPAEDAPVCAKCGSKIRKGALFCATCGTKMAEQPALAPTPAPAPVTTSPIPPAPPVPPMAPEIPMEPPVPVKRGISVKLIIALTGTLAAIAAVVLAIIFMVLPALNYSKGAKALNDQRYEQAYALLEPLGDYKDAPDLIRKGKTEQVFDFLNDGKYEEAFKIIPSLELTTDFRSKLYKAGQEALEEEYYKCAYMVFEYLEDYKLSTAYYNQALAMYYSEWLKDCAVGDAVEFGAIEQDGNTENGKEKINWIVVSKDAAGVSLMSEKVLLQARYNKKSKSISWKDSTLRTYLNGTFAVEAFGDVHRTMLLSAADSDMVTLLSSEQAADLLEDSSIDHTAELTKAAKDGIKDVEKDKVTDGWWLQTASGKKAQYVDTDGNVGKAAMSEWKGVRPVITLTTFIPVVYAEPNTDTDVDVNANAEAPEQTNETNQPITSDPSKKSNPFLNANVGDVITFGTYEQDGNTENGKEDISWLVLDKDPQSNNVLVISLHGLDCQPYHSKYEDVVWENSSIRSWLNSSFYNMAFDYEKEFIQNSYIYNDDNSERGTDGGNDTTDHLFLLSETEANVYFRSNDERICYATDYAKAKGAYVNDTTGGSWWWLRTPGYNNKGATLVRSVGDTPAGGDDVNNGIGVVRPAMWVTTAQ